ncbi:MAG: hypothetical protein J1E43_06065 [Christensenellaceae bacterium]|nr:hypothetical protein [Christensenellaceae bacterium]
MKPMEQELKNMFGQTPDSFSLAMERALAGEKPARETPAPRRLRKVWTVVLIAALVLALATGAYAVAVRLGLLDLSAMNELGVFPPSAQNILESTEVQTFEVGPLTVSLNSVMTDGYVIYQACQSRVTDGSRALLTDWTNGLYSEIPDGYSAYADAEGLAGNRLGDLAAQWEGQLYSVSTRLEVDYSVVEGGEMLMDPVWGADGSIVTGNMIELNPAEIGESLPATLFINVHEMTVNEFDLYSWVCDVEIGENWQLRVPMEVPVYSAVETRQYQVEGSGDLGIATVTGAEIERTGVELYVHVAMTVADETRKYYEVPWFELLDENGEPLPAGLLETFYINHDNWPEAVVTLAVGMDEMPDVVRIPYEDYVVTLK